MDEGAAPGQDGAEVDPSRELLPAMSPEDIDFLLGLPGRTGHLATSRSDGSPQIGAVWFQWVRPDLVVVTRAETARVRNAQKRPRVAFSFDLGVFPPTGVTLQGVASFEPPTRSVLLPLLNRYLPPGTADEYCERYMSDPLRVVMRVATDRLIAWDGSRRSR